MTNVDKYEKLRELVNKTNKEKPKPEDITALQRFFDSEPELWRATGNMATRTLDHLIRSLATRVELSFARALNDERIAVVSGKLVGELPHALAVSRDRGLRHDFSLIQATPRLSVNGLHEERGKLNRCLTRDQSRLRLMKLSSKR